MAITILENPQKFRPVYNPIIVTASSNNTHQTGFKYAVEITDSNSNVLYTYKIEPEPVHGYLVLDVSRVLESYVSFDFSNSSINLALNPNSYLSYGIAIGEEYEVNGVLTVFNELAIIDDLYCINASLNHLDFTKWTHDDFFNTGSEPTRFLTNSPKKVKIRENQSYWLYMLHDALGSLDKIKIETFDYSGTPLGEYTIDNPNGTSASDEHYHLRIPSGTNIKDYPIINPVSGSLPIIDSLVHSYHVSTITDLGNTSSEVMEFEIDRSCSKFGELNLYFLNELGGFDSKSFELVRHRSFNKQTESYQKQWGALGSSGLVKFSVNDHLKRQYHTSTSETIKITSNWITEDESKWLRELFDSPVVYAEIDSELIACTIKETSYKQKTRSADRLFNLELTLELAFNNYRQRW